MIDLVVLLNFLKATKLLNQKQLDRIENFLAEELKKYNLSKGAYDVLNMDIACNRIIQMFADHPDLPSAAKTDYIKYCFSRLISK